MQPEQIASLFDAVKQAALTSRDPRQTPIWNLVRVVRGWFVESVAANDAFLQVDPLIRRPEIGGWQARFGLDDEAAYTHFLQHWQDIKYRPGQSPLTNARKMADAHLADTTTQRSNNSPRPMRGYNRFVAFAACLQFSMGKRKILLPVRDVAAELGTDKDTVSIWCRWAQDDGFLICARKSRFRRDGNHEAAEYRFSDDYLPWYSKRIKTSRSTKKKASSR